MLEQKGSGVKAMPIIHISFIKDVVANEEQMRDLQQKMTDTFISVVGEVARPYTYCIINEVPQMHWSIGGRPMPDLAFLVGPEYAGYHAQANDIMRGVITQASEDGQAAATNGAQEKARRADAIWGGQEG
jgi:4-oxalocrotonate tautomerase